MKSDCHEEQSDNKKGYVFFSDPDIIVKRAETSAVEARIRQNIEAEQQTSQKQPFNSSIPRLRSIKSLENLTSFHPVQPYPFTFISAVKQKLALGDYPGTSTKAHEEDSHVNSNLTSSVLRRNSKQNLCQFVQKMDFVKPLKVPDLKISPKVLDFSSRENTISKEMSLTKSEITPKEFVHDRSDKTVKSSERVQRKLDFFATDGPSVINSESIEPLKAPNVSIASNLSKKKEHLRDISREKENVSKRIKKDDSSGTKKDELVQHQIKRNKSPRRLSRRDATNMSGAITKLRNDRLPFHVAKDNDFLSTKSKTRNFATSTIKKHNDRKQKAFNAQSVELTRDNILESNDLIYNNKTLFLQSCKIPDKITRDNFNNVMISSSNSENKPKDYCHLKQADDLTHKCDSESRQLKQNNTIHKEQTKRASDKSKTSNNKIESKIHNINSEISEDIVQVIPETNSSRNRTSVYPISCMQRSINKDSEIIMENKQNTNSARSSKSPDNVIYTENSIQSTTISSKKEESHSQSITTKLSTDDSNELDVNALPDALFDPRRISFRDSSYSQQEDFPNLVTPEKMNLMIKSKRRKHLIQSDDSEADNGYPRYKLTTKSEKEQEKLQLMHPTALHMQFQAELNLLDSFNESLRQVMDVEKCLCSTKYEQEQKNSKKENENANEVQIEESHRADRIDNDTDINNEKAWRSLDYIKEGVAETWKPNECNETHFDQEHCISSQGNIDESSNNVGKFNKGVKVAEVQTQTVNDIATQTDKHTNKWNAQSRFSGDRNIYEHTFSEENEIPQLSLNSAEKFEDLDQIEKISLPSKIRTMSEISLHETTSSIKTETGTEISIATRDVKCFISDYFDFEIAQLIQDEKLRHDTIGMWIKKHEKTLHEIRTMKLVELEEQKRALGDKRDSRSLKKKQRALLLKFQQEKDDINKLRQLHEIASQERKLMFQKQRNMFNPQISTKNILTKLKRSADSQSPRRLSGPMKGYDIRSNSSMSSLVDSDKSQHDRSQVDTRLQAIESDIHFSKLDFVKSDKSVNLAEESNTSATKFADLTENNQLQDTYSKIQKISKHELNSRKYEEKMPKTDILKLKSHQLGSKLIKSHPLNIKRLLENQKSIEISQSLRPELNTSVPGFVKCGSDTLVELSKRSKTSQIVDPFPQDAVISKEKELASNVIIVNNEGIEEQIDFKIQDTISKTTKSSQVSEDILQTNINKNSKKIDRPIAGIRDVTKTGQYNTELKAKRKNSKYQKERTSNTLTEDILRSKLNSYISEELIKYHDKQTEIEDEPLQLTTNESSILGEIDLNESQNSLQALIRHSRAVKDKNSKLLKEVINDYESKDNISSQALSKRFENGQHFFRNEQDVRNISTSQINAFAVSYHSSGESEKNCSKSIVVRSQDRDLKASKNFEQILTARETALASRKHCVEEWMSWHAKLRAEEDRVTRMEQAALKLVAATSNVLFQQDTTVSSDTSDVEGRIELLTERLAERRIEMSRLKREAKRQAKQKLRTLEANLLNQIERYDTTIDEMRKKLESKKIIKDNAKLAIEAKSLADFKVPKIPLKIIQDIYKNSDLLRSKSESDLLLARNQQENSLKTVNSVIDNDKYENKSIPETIKSADIINDSVLKTTTDSNSIQSSFDECTSTKAYDKLQTAISNDSSSAKYTVSALDTNKKLFNETMSKMKQNSVSLDLGNIQTDMDTVRSELENIETVDSISANINIDQSQSEFSTIQSEIQQQENADCSETIPSKSDIDSNNDILTISKKLNFLQLNNKNLNDDISSLENELKTLSEMMSHFSKKSSETSKIDHEEKSTPQEISEIISKSVFSDEIVNIKTEDNERASLEKEMNTESLSIPKNEKKSISCNDSSDEMQEIITEEAPTLSNSTHEIDYEAKSKEIMNEIEKSIISEHKICDDYNTVSQLEISIQNLHKDNEDLLNDLISLEFDIKSVSEILSKTSENRKNHDSTINSAMQITPDFKENITEQNDLSERILNEDAKDQVVHSPIIAGHRLSKSNVVNSKDNLGIISSTISNTISHILTSENLKLSESSEVPQDKIYAIDNIKITNNFKCNKDIEGTTLNDTVNTNQSQTISIGNISMDKDWTTSESFEIAQNKIDTHTQERDTDFKDSRSCMNETSKNISDAENSSNINNIKIEKDEIKLASDIEDVSIFIQKEESANFNITSHKTVDSYIIKTNDELDDILDIIAREDKQKKDISDNENKIFHKIIFDFLTDLLDQVESIVENREKNVDNHFRTLYDNEVDISADNRNETIPNISLLNKPQEEIDVKDINTSKICSTNICNNNKFSNNQKDVIDTSLQAVEEIDNKSINANVQMEINNEESLHEAISEVQELIITELDSDSIEDHVLPELQIDAKVELADEEEFNTNDINADVVPIKIQECLEPILEQDSSDGEQLDNLVEIAESGLETVEKFVIPSQSSEVSIDNIISIQAKKAEDNINTYQKKKNDDIAKSDSTLDNINKTFDILKDPDGEDISEESLEISEILDKNDFPKASSPKKSVNLSQKYETMQKSGEVIKIFDEISQKSLTDSISNSLTNEKNTQSAPSVTEISELLGVEVSTEDDISANMNNIAKNKMEEQFHKVNESRNYPVKETVLQEKLSMETVSDVDSAEEKSSGISLRLHNQLHDADDKNSHMIYELHERVLQLHEQDDSTESGEGGDTPRGVSEIDMDSPRDFNDSKLDMDILDDDLLSSGKATIQSVDVKTNFHPTSIIATSDKDIEAMIDKLKASLEQPGLEVADLEAKLLRIEQLQIELEIKKLEAEEVSYYVREIPNKPPPPYTPPGDGRLSTSLGSPSLLTAVIPSNVEELTAFTEKATALIYDAKLSGENIADLETPSEIYELNKEKDETVGKDRRIYNAFLFDLCKETITDVYRAEYEKPGPSWTKPNVKTKPMMKIPKNVEELTEYVSKEVATLFGFKTKLQRENMVMRWSRKRRDRVDELLAREAQAEEDEWTKFHHDELAVKNGLTVAILDTLIMETVNVVKIAYGKKRKLMI